jgi:hypothetical protein
MRDDLASMNESALEKVTELQRSSGFAIETKT